MGYNYLWIWGVVSTGMNYYYIHENEIFFIDHLLGNIFPLIISIICFLMLLIIAFLFVWLFFNMKNGVIEIRSLKYIGISTIIIILSYAILIDISFNIYLSDSLSIYPGMYKYTNFWTNLGLGVGFILPFISGGFSIFGAYLIKRNSNRNYESPKKKD